MDNEENVESDLLDVARFDLDALAAIPGTVLAASLRRALDERLEPPDYFAAFQNRL
ncbi:FxSxx-COOH cyclophane-containing RiPP peptide [Umezawaea tangerina]|uniref:FXSXX-COOH protein n=1 Tax=Umezawaea tangerina TaxID=84725 RepID=A0A2T0SWN1_9PSEU|nr:FxSxx-COOH cyclophane-containing RiPP peptide [Umezawaea tangerina]PRY37827.1 FXSXX-COOH protein [Umezawaea tangerina]